ncbi:MAG: hypothetical protein RSE38_16005, partial [Acinetobacter sp.]
NKPDFERDVLRQVRGEVKVKKKLSVGLVLTIILVFAVMAALATTLLWLDHVPQVSQTEYEHGAYWNWPVAEKENLVRLLMDVCCISDCGSTDRLFAGDTSENEKIALADELVLDVLKSNHYTKVFAEKDGIGSVNWQNITYALMGYQDQWKPEQRVWLQNIEAMYGDPTSDYTLVNSEENDLSEQEAISIAKSAIIRSFSMPDDELDHALVVADLYITDERPAYRRWYIEFQLFDESQYPDADRIYWTFVDSAGNLIADSDRETENIEEFASESAAWSEKDLPPLLQSYCSYAEEEESYLVRGWSIETKAAYSSEMRSQVLAVLASGNLSPITNPNSRFGVPNQELIASTQFAYGLPQTGDLNEEQALAAAREIIESEYGTSRELLMEQWSYYSYFDITVPSRPLWRIIYYPDSFEGMRHVPVYRIELNPQTGIKYSANRYEWKQLFEEKPYNEKWY